MRAADPRAHGVARGGLRGSRRAPGVQARAALRPGHQGARRKVHSDGGPARYLARGAAHLALRRRRIPRRGRCAAAPARGKALRVHQLALHPPHAGGVLELLPHDVALERRVAAAPARGDPRPARDLAAVPDRVPRHETAGVSAHVLCVRHDSARVAVIHPGGGCHEAALDTALRQRPWPHAASGQALAAGWNRLRGGRGTRV